MPRITQQQPIWLQRHEGPFMVRVRPWSALPTSPPSPLPSPNSYQTACTSSQTPTPPILGISVPIHVAPWPGMSSPQPVCLADSSKALLCHHLQQKALPEDLSPGWVKKPLGQPRPYAVIAVVLFTKVRENSDPQKAREDSDPLKAKPRAFTPFSSQQVAGAHRV